MDRKVERPAVREKLASVGRIVHVFRHEGDRLVPNAAMITHVGDDGKRVRCQVWWEVGHCGETRDWYEYSETPRDGFWSWPKTV
jgi:hypothetical protein